MRRTLNKMQIELATAPIETVLALVLARYARKEIIAQHGEAQLLADSNATPSKWLLGLWNSMRRDAELIAVLEPRVSEDRTPSLAEYLEAKESAASATCAASSAVGATSPSTSAGALKGEPAAAPGEPTPFRTDPGDPPPQHPE
jgi:hypothetical protein